MVVENIVVGICEFVVVYIVVVGFFVGSLAVGGEANNYIVGLNVIYNQVIVFYLGESCIVYINGVYDIFDIGCFFVCEVDVYVVVVYFFYKSGGKVDDGVDDIV